VSIFPNIFPADGDNFYFERELRSRGYKCVVGTDEVGRGPLAGPVVASCVSLPHHCDPSPFLDSKVTSHNQRIKLADLLKCSGAVIGVGIVSHSRIDTVNILQASLIAMKLAVFHHTKIFRHPDFILVDGKFEIPMDTHQQPLIKGESKSASIAAASIIAKLQRDGIMAQLHHRYPHYNFKQNKGYPTKQHRDAIAMFGPCPYHRQSFKGVREFVL